MLFQENHSTDSKTESITFDRHFQFLKRFIKDKAIK